MSFGERLKLLREENGYSTRKKLAEELDIPDTTLRNYETDVREPGHRFLKQISDFFNVSTDYLLGLTDEKEKSSTHQLKTSEYEHIKKYRALDPFGQETVTYILDRETARVQQLKEKAGNIISFEPCNNKIPVRLISYYYKNASAGTGQLIIDNLPEQDLEIPDIPEYRNVSYAIGVNGNSMEPTYFDGDILLVEATRELQLGDIGIFQVDEKCYVKKLGETELISLNPDAANIPLDESAWIMGKVIGKL